MIINQIAGGVGEEMVGTLSSFPADETTVGNRAYLTTKKIDTSVYGQPIENRYGFRGDEVIFKKTIAAVDYNVEFTLVKIGYKANKVLETVKHKVKDTTDDFRAFRWNNETWFVYHEGYSTDVIVVGPDGTKHSLGTTSSLSTICLLGDDLLVGFNDKVYDIISLPTFTINKYNSPTAIQASCVIEGKIAIIGSDKAIDANTGNVLKTYEGVSNIRYAEYNSLQRVLIISNVNRNKNSTEVIPFGDGVAQVISFPMVYDCEGHHYHPSSRIDINYRGFVPYFGEGGSFLTTSTITLNTIMWLYGKIISDKGDILIADDIGDGLSFMPIAKVKDNLASMVMAR